MEGMKEFEHPTEPEPVGAELTAYLDGELTEEEATLVEEKLASDESLQEELHGLQGVWDALDMLPQVSADEHFAQTTIEMVTAQVAEEVEAKKSAAASTMPWWIGAAVLCALICFSIGYFAVLTVASRENQQLAEDLPMLERVDEYEQIENIELLELLNERGLFSAEGSDDI